MTIIDLIKREAGAEIPKLMILAVLGGASNALIMALVNTAASGPAEERLSQFIRIAVATATYAYCLRRTNRRVAEIIESAVQKIRLDLIDKLARAQLQALESIGTSLVYDRLTENVATISGAVGAIVAVMQSICVLVFATAYILVISPTSFVLLGIIIGLGIMMWAAKNEEMKHQLEWGASRRVNFLDQLTDLLRGFKELQLGRKRWQEIRKDLNGTAEELRAVGIAESDMQTDNMIFSSCILFAMLAAVVFVLPEHTKIESSELTSLVGAVLFFWAPMLGVVTGMPSYIRSNVALASIDDLEKKIANATNEHVGPEKVVDPWHGKFTSIQLNDVRYAYPPDEEGRRFEIGPMNLSIAAGEVIFLVGGNGSGKSTLVKILTGLYTASGGQLKIDGFELTNENRPVYREMYAAIFADFHLFSRLYGLLDADEELARKLLKQMQIDNKTSFEKGRFTNRNLSTGQRKRLAMVVAMLEDRPVFLFDEWAADQDPEFREYFYKELIPMLKQRGKTVFAVSHDSSYFDCADRVITLEYGRVKSIISVTRQAPVNTTITVHETT